METDQVPNKRAIQQPDSQGKPTDCNSLLAWTACLRKKRRGKAALHLNIANGIQRRGGEREQSGGTMSQMQINLEIWASVHLDESDSHPWACCRHSDANDLFIYYITHHFIYTYYLCPSTNNYLILEGSLIYFSGPVLCAEDQILIWHVAKCSYS